MARFSLRTYQALATACIFAVVLFFLERAVSSTFVAALQRSNSALHVFGITLPLRLMANAGFVFSLPLPPIAIYSLALLALIVVSRAFLQAVAAPWSLFVASYSLILAGAASNLVSRLQQGFVWDYIVIRFWQWEGVWNLADFSILSGAILWWVTSGKQQKSS